jgi:hypothetical protein
MFHLFLLKFLDFMICNDAINKYSMEKKSIKMVDERGENANGGSRVEKKYEITTSLFSR